MITLILTLVPLFPSSIATLQEAAQGRAMRVEPDLEALRGELANVRVSLVADRAYAEAEGQLAALRERLVTRTDAEGKTLLTELDFLAADVARALGRGAMDMVDQAALDAIAANNWGFVGQLGLRAVPALAEAVRRNPEALPGSSEEDPLVYLTRLDVMETDRLAAELLDSGAFFWKLRLLRVLKLTEFGDKEEDWARMGPPWVLRAKGIVAALERYLLDPEVQAAALDLVSTLEARDARFVNFERALDSALRATGRPHEVAEKAAQRVVNDRRAFIERLLDDPDAQLRRLAVNLLAPGTDVSTLWFQSAGDVDARVRREVARALATDGWWSSFPPEAFLGLLRDEDPETRELAWSLLEKLPVFDEPVDLAVAERLPGMAEQVRRAHIDLPVRSEDLVLLTGEPERLLLARVAPGLPAAICFRILEDLARDEDQEILKAVSKSLRESPYYEAPEAYVAVLDRLWQNERAPRDLQLVARVRTRSGVKVLFPWMVARRDGQAIAQALLQREAAQLEALEPDLAIESLAVAYEADPAGVDQLLTHGAGQELYQDEPFLDALVGLAGEENRALDLRLLAMEVASRHEAAPARREAVAPALFGALRKQGWKLEQQSSIERILRRLPDATVNRILADWVRDPGFPVRDGANLVKCFRRDGPGAKEVVEAVIEVGQRDLAQGDRALVAVMDAMGNVSALRDPAFLERMALGPNGYLSREALQAIGKSSEPRYLPLLVSLVGEASESAVFEHATRALIHYLDEEAVEPILMAARRADPELRALCIAHLETIREYHDARERLATHLAKRQTREQVIAQLLGQLDAKDDETRVQAIRALATWEAVEAMPRLIELSTSPSNAVASAAKAALDRLNAPRGE